MMNIKTASTIVGSHREKIHPLGPGNEHRTSVAGCNVDESNENNDFAENTTRPYLQRRPLKKNGTRFSEYS